MALEKYKDEKKPPVPYQVLAFILLASINIFIPFIIISAIDIDFNWYGKLIKPSFVPPVWFFEQVLWTILHLMVAFSAWHLYVNRLFSGHRIAAYICQGFFNFIWTPIFFGGHQLFLALLDTILQLISVVWSVVGFGVVDKIAAVALIPYLGWVIFATWYNGALWYLNQNNHNLTMSGGFLF